MKLGDKEIKSLARNMRKCCRKTLEDDCLTRKCKYYEKCVKTSYLLNDFSIKELADELRGAGF